MRFLLGVADDGVVYFGVDGSLPGPDGPAAAGGPDAVGATVRSGSSSAAVAGAAGEVRAAPLREVGPLLSDRDAGLMTHAVALANFHDTHHFCPNCGEPSDAGVLGPRPALHGGGHRRVPPQRPGHDRAGHRPGRPGPAGPERGLARAPRVDPGRVRGGGGVGRAGGGPRGAGGGRHRGGRRALPGQPAVADAAEPDARVPRRGRPASMELKVDDDEIAEAAGTAGTSCRPPWPTAPSGCPRQCRSRTRSSSPGTAARCPAAGDRPRLGLDPAWTSGPRPAVRGPGCAPAVRPRP